MTQINYLSDKHKLLMCVSPRAGNGTCNFFMRTKYKSEYKVYDINKNDTKFKNADGLLPSYDAYYDEAGFIKDKVTKLYKPDIDMYFGL